MSLTTTIPFSNITQAPHLNARKTNKSENIDQLKSSIISMGLIQPIAVRPKDGTTDEFEVVDGARRFQAIIELIEESTLKDNFPVPCLVREEDETDMAAKETSLAANVLRLPMGIIDEFRAFADLASEGQTPDQIADRFGIGSRRVRQRLALAALSPTVISGLEAGHINIDVATKFTLIKSHEDQDKIMSDNDGRPGSWNVTSTLREKIATQSALGKQIEVPDYIERGGTITEDLFGTDSVFDNPELVLEILREMHKPTMDKLQSENWSWVVFEEDAEQPYYNLGRLYGKRADLSDEDQVESKAINSKLEELRDILNDDDTTEENLAVADEEHDTLTDQLKSLEDKRLTFTDEQKQNSGCYISLENGHINYGLQTAEQVSANKKETQETDTPKGLSAALMLELTDEVTRITQNAISANPRLALAVMLANQACAGMTPCDITSQGRIYQKTTDLGFNEAVRAFMKEPIEKLLEYAAINIAGSMNVGTSNFYGWQRQDTQHFIDFCEPDLTDIDLETPGFFKRCTAADLHKAIKDITGKAPTKKVKDMKRKELGDHVKKLAEGTHWLPMEIRTESYAGPGA